MVKNVFQPDDRYVVHGNVEKRVEAAKEDWLAEFGALDKKAANASREQPSDEDDSRKRVSLRQLSLDVSGGVKTLDSTYDEGQRRW
jgi:hypothetical protein